MPVCSYCKILLSGTVKYDFILFLLNKFAIILYRFILISVSSAHFIYENATYTRN